MLSFHKNFTQFSAGPISRSGPNAAASIAPTLIRHCIHGMQNGSENRQEVVYNIS